MESSPLTQVSVPMSEYYEPLTNSLISRHTSMLEMPSAKHASPTLSQPVRNTIWQLVSLPTQLKQQEIQRYAKNAPSMAHTDPWLFRPFAP